MNFGKWVGLICFIITLVILWKIRQMLLLFFLAVVVATALNSLTQRFQKGGVKRPIAVVLTLGLVALSMTLFIGLVMPPFIDQFRSLIQRLPIGFNQVARQVELFIENPPAWMPEIELDVPEISALSQQLQPILQNLIQNFLEFFNSSLFLVLKTLLVFALTLMMLADPRSYRQGFIKLFPSFYRRRTDEILTYCEIALGNWLGGILINSIFVAVASGIGLSLLQVDFVLAHSLLAGMLNFVPNIGPVLSVIFPLSIALLGPPWKAIAQFYFCGSGERYWPFFASGRLCFGPFAVSRNAQLCSKHWASAECHFSVVDCSARATLESDRCFDSVCRDSKS